MLLSTSPEKGRKKGINRLTSVVFKMVFMDLKLVKSANGFPCHHPGFKMMWTSANEGFSWIFTFPYSLAFPFEQTIDAFPGFLLLKFKIQSWIPTNHHKHAVPSLVYGTLQILYHYILRYLNSLVFAETPCGVPKWAPFSVPRWEGVSGWVV